jgi:PAS domain S-box-containing protein
MGIVRGGDEVTWLTVDSAPIPLEGYGVAIAYSDITERKRAEDALQESESRLRAVFDVSPAGIILVDLKGYITYANQGMGKMFRCTQQEMIGSSYADHVHPDQRRIGDEQMRQLIAGEIDSVVYERHYIRRDGTDFYGFLSGRRHEDKKGNLISIVGNIADITEQKCLEDQLRQAQKLESIGTLAGGIAHDFNNILYPLLGFAELLKEDLPTDSPLQEHINEILQATMRSKDLVKQILAFSRKGDQSAKPIKLHPIVKEALKLIRSSIPATIDIQQDIDSDCGLVIADPTQIHQVVMNLATNAFHAMEDSGGILKVSLKQKELVSASGPSIIPALTPGNYALLTVSDTGIGIKKEILSKIFDPYFTTKGVGKGTGLGLSVAHGIVKTYKGEVLIDSTTGKGTDVHVYLPIMESTIKDKSVADIETLPGGTEKILLVDDEPPIIRVEQRILEKLGYHVSTRTSSTEALTTFQAAPADFDLVLTDMTMPNMTGIQLAEKIISIRPDIPIILCTGYSEKMGDEKTKSIGIKRFLMKPADKSEMAKMVRQVLDEAYK